MCGEIVCYGADYNQTATPLNMILKKAPPLRAAAGRYCPLYAMLKV